MIDLVGLIKSFREDRLKIIETFLANIKETASMVNCPSSDILLLKKELLDKRSMISARLDRQDPLHKDELPFYNVWLNVDDDSDLPNLD